MRKLFLLMMGVAATATAQPVVVGTDADLRLRAAQLNGLLPTSWSLQVRPTYESRFLLKEGANGLDSWVGIKDNPRKMFWIEPAPVVSQSFFNSRTPWGWNDRGVWQGRGITQSVQAGLRGGAGPLEIQIQPEYVWHQNRAYDTLGISNWRYSRQQARTAWISAQRNRIDNPFVYGDGAFTRLWGGQSYAKLNLGKFQAGVSSENLWWGPGVHQALFMTNNAPGIPHVFLGTRAPLHSYIGSFEGRIISGRLENSDQKLFPRKNQWRYVSAAVFTYSPSFMPGLSVGATRVFQIYSEDMENGWRGYFPLFQKLFKKNFSTADNKAGDDRADQMASVTVRWAMPESGAEFYGEFGRIDHSWDMRDFLTQPEHASGYMFGFRKDLLPSKMRSLIAGIEFTKLENTNTRMVREYPQFYEHHIITEGWTQFGQIIGSGIGPGSNLRVASLQYVDPVQTAGFRAMHQPVNSSHYYAHYTIRPDYWRNWVDVIFEASYLRRFGAFQAGLTIARITSYNRYYLYKNDPKNYNASLTLQYTF